jgi:hypothetical protein
MKPLLASAAWLLVVASALGQSLDDRVKSVLPTADEDRWTKIPWRTNLAEARSESEKTGKPILYWVMNGNPLGCA